MTEGRVLINTINNVGPRTDPWGTPLDTQISEEREPQTLTLEVRPEIKELSQRQRGPSIPSPSKCCMRRLWGMTSKALEKSKKIQSIFCFTSAAFDKSFRKMVRLLRQDRVGRKPCWAGWRRLFEIKKDCNDRLIIFSMILQGIEVKLIGR
jgi:hypothetical protein